MKWKVVLFMIFSILLMSGFNQLSAIDNSTGTNDFGEQGIFEAELGRRGNDESIISMEGNYQVKDRFIVIYGTATLREKEGHFRGVLKGNYLMIRIPIRGRAINLIGRFNFNDDSNTFQGLWMSRPLHLRGWITGALIPT